MSKQDKEQSFALCIENKECEDLEKRKVYMVLPDDEAAKEGYLRIVDETGYETAIFFKNVAEFSKFGFLIRKHNKYSSVSEPKHLMENKLWEHLTS